MRLRASSFFWFSVAGLLWPCLALAMAFLSPGPGSSSSSLPQPSAAEVAYASPPVDLSGSLHFVAGPGGTAKAQVFWEEPTRARVKISIELPAEGQPAPAQVAPEQNDSVPYEYRVYAGSYRDRLAAEAALLKARQAGVNGSIIQSGSDSLVFVGEFASYPETFALMDKLKKLGYSGAFTTRKRR